MQKLYDKKRISSYSISNQNNKDLVEVQSPSNIGVRHQTIPTFAGDTNKGTEISQKDLNESRRPLPISVHAHQWK